MLKQTSTNRLPLTRDILFPQRTLYRPSCRQSTTTHVMADTVTLEGQIKTRLENVCVDCRGKGRLPAGGYHKRNPLNVSRIVGTKWTAREKLLGWRHFIVTEKRKTRIADYALLVATCDTEAKLWVNVHNLKDRLSWACGWLQRTQLAALDASETGFASCKSCGGTGLAGFQSLQPLH